MGLIDLVDLTDLVDLVDLMGLGGRVEGSSARSRPQAWGPSCC